MNITDLQKPELDKLAKDPRGVVQASLNMHRDKLENTSEIALEKLHNSIENATVDQTVKIYDTTRKHLNVLDGRVETTQVPIIVLPQVLIQREAPKEVIDLNSSNNNNDNNNNDNNNNDNNNNDNNNNDNNNNDNNNNDNNNNDNNNSNNKKINDKKTKSPVQKLPNKTRNKKRTTSRTKM